MANNSVSKIRKMQWYLTYALIAAVGLFALYLVFAGFGIVWLKILTAALSALLCLGCLWFLYMTNSLIRPRSLWMTTAAGAILICLMFSLALNFPSPNKYKLPEAPAETAAYTVLQTDELL